ncbi:hypothetical protein AZOA_48000 [Azoarcus sp. Aa7]|nr:hypothetical protein [Azoarcus sp. Aa7]
MAEGLPQTPQYSWIYKDLVEDEGDIIGAIAYSIYKSRKIEYIRQFEDEHGRSPNDDELAEFNRAAKLPGQLEDYRDKAERYIDEFLEAVLAERIRVAEQELLQSRFIKEIRPKWWRGIVDNVVAAVLTSALTVVLLIFLWVQAVGTDRLMSDILNHYFPRSDKSAEISGHPSVR